MRVIFSKAHEAHFPKGELHDGAFVTPFERPERMAHILARLAERGFPTPDAPEAYDPAPVAALHDAGYLTFLATAWERWTAAGHTGEMIPTCFPTRRMAQICPAEIDGKLGYYAFAAETAITAGTWSAAQGAAATAATAAGRVADGARAVFALCRPPGHHAARDLFGGYCFLNNAAIAAEILRRRGAARVAILDIDFHHGNGTQDIFYDRSDVLFISLHGHPEEAFPHFLGFAEETGAGHGAGFTVNYPMGPGTGYALWSEALAAGLAEIARFRADALVVSLGTDTFTGDPISFFRLESGDYTDIGRRLAAPGLATVFVMEGGYAIAEIGVNTVNLLEGFLNA